MMGDIFYLIGVIFFVHEVIILQNTKDYIKKKKMVENFDRDKTNMMSEGDKNKFAWFIIISMSYLAWGTIGAIFSGQWIFFVCFLIFGTAIGYYNKKVNKDNEANKIMIMKADAFVSSLFVVFVILNHFHHIV